MKNIYIGYSDFTNTLYAYSKKDYSDKQDVSKQFVNIVRKVCKLNDSKEIKIGDLILQIKEIKEKWKVYISFVKDAESVIVQQIEIFV